MSDQRSWRDVLEVHPAADLFPMLDRDQLVELGENIKKNGLTSPVVVWTPTNNDTKPRYLLDGRNRLDAMEAVGIRLVDGRGTFMPKAVRFRLRQDVLQLCGKVVQVDGETPSDTSGTDPYEYVLAANIHRRHLNARQKRELIAKVLKARPEMTDRRAAKLTGASHTTVATVRDDLEANGQIGHSIQRESMPGRKAPGRKAGGRRPRAKKSPPSTIPEPSSTVIQSTRPTSQPPAMAEASDSEAPERSTPEKAAGEPAGNVTKPADLAARRILRELAGIDPADLSDPIQVATDLIAQARRLTPASREATA